MPQYEYINDDTKETIILIQSMNDIHEYYGSDGKKWRRIFYSPQVAIDVEINPESSKDFVEKTGKKKGTLGNIWDASKEAGLKRQDIMGHDPVYEKSVEDWKKKRQRKDGSLRKHPSEVSNNIQILAD